MFVCTVVYRSLGVHLSKVRSITLDSWEPELLKVMSELGNERVNQIYEAVVSDEYSRPVHNSLRSELSACMLESKRSQKRLRTLSPSMYVLHCTISWSGDN